MPTCIYAPINGWPEVEVPYELYLNHRRLEPDQRLVFHRTLYVEREEDWYALGSPQFRNQIVRVIKAKDYRTARQTN